MRVTPSKTLSFLPACFSLDPVHTVWIKNEAAWHMPDPDAVGFQSSSDAKMHAYRPERAYSVGFRYTGYCLRFDAVLASSPCMSSVGISFAVDCLDLCIFGSWQEKYYSRCCC